MIDRRKKYYLVFDVETAGGLDNPLVYDVGFLVMDKKGKVYKTGNYLIKEIICNKSLMSTAYYSQKLPKYRENYKKGKMIMLPFLDIRLIIFEILKEYRITNIWAYNARFDINALNNTGKHLMGLNTYFALDTKVCCIWNFACQTLCLQKSFFKFVKDHQFMTEKGNLRTSAEIVFAYMTGNKHYEEEHTGLEDCYIEGKILSRCFRQHKKFSKRIISFPWKPVTAAYNRNLQRQIE